MSSRGILTPRCNSHPFQERTLNLDQQVKIGRSVARAKPASNNAIFDCKVLSRNHALLWYDDGKFYLQDTRSSNGTFVNNKCLGKGAEESAPREVCSGDIVQFGVDVMENAGKVTHGCIIATLKLYFPDGKEAKASPSTSLVQGESVSLEDLYVLNNYLQDALHRESQLEVKLHTLQRLLDDVHKSSEFGWKALMSEDRLLTHIDSLEAQLQKYSKNVGEDTLRDEVKKLQEDKNTYQETAKESLQKVIQEKLEVVQKYQNLEQAVKIAETQNVSLKQKLDTCQVDLQELARKYSQQSVQVREMGVVLQTTENSHRETCERMEQQKRELKDKLVEQMEVARHLQSNLNTVEGYLEVALQQFLCVQSDLESMYDVAPTEVPIDSIRDRIKAAIAFAMDKLPRDTAELRETARKEQKKANLEDNTVSPSVRIGDCEKFNSQCEFIECPDTKPSKADYDVSEKEFEIDGDRQCAKSIKQEAFDSDKGLLEACRDRSLGEKADDKDPEESESLRKLQREAQQSEKIVRNGIENMSAVANNSSFEAEMQQLKSENSVLRKENHFMQQQFSADLLEVETLKAKNYMLSENIEELQTELVTLRERYTECSLERTRLINDFQQSELRAGSNQSVVTQQRLFIPLLCALVAFIFGLWIKL